MFFSAPKLLKPYHRDFTEHLWLTYGQEQKGFPVVWFENCKLLQSSVFSWSQFARDERNIFI